MTPAKLWPPAALPNSEGFRFIGYDSEGRRYRCEVVDCYDGECLVDGMEFSEMVGWTNEVGK